MGLERLELWNLLDGVQEPVVEPILKAAYEFEEWKIWRYEERNPHGAPWFTSFHASQAPGDNRIACGRLAVYQLLDPPSAEPLTPHLRAWFDLGKNLELEWVRRLAGYGVLLSADQTAGDEFQTGFIDEEHWLTGASDAIILPPHSRKAHVVEAKTTSHEKVLAMQNSGQVPKRHDQYVRQLKTYIGLAHEAPFSPKVSTCKISGRLVLADGKCPGLHQGACDIEAFTVQPPDDGTLIYSSREEPLRVVSFGVSYDPAFLKASREKLAAWRDAFLADQIPEHPHEGKRAKWSVEPCSYCEMKANVCKLDYQNHVTRLSESNLIAFARSIRPTWDYEEKRKAVLARWGADREEISVA